MALGHACRWRKSQFIFLHTNRELYIDTAQNSVQLPGICLLLLFSFWHILIIKRLGLLTWLSLCRNIYKQTSWRFHWIFIRSFIWHRKWGSKLCKCSLAGLVYNVQEVTKIERSYSKFFLLLYIFRYMLPKSLWNHAFKIVLFFLNIVSSPIS